jgi:hypothetical protein
LVNEDDQPFIGTNGGMLRSTKEEGKIVKYDSDRCLWSMTQRDDVFDNAFRQCRDGMPPSFASRLIRRSYKAEGRKVTSDG